MPIDAIIDQLWDASGGRGNGTKGRALPHDPRKVLQGYVSRLRNVLKRAGVPGNVRTEGGHYVLNIDPDFVDYHRFHEHVSAGQHEYRAHNYERAAELLTEAVELWQGQPFADLPTSWAQRKAETLEANEFLPVCFDLCHAELALGRADHVLEIIRARLSGHESDPRLVELRMRVLDAMDSRSSLISYYHDAVAAVRRDFDDASADHVTRLYDELSARVPPARATPFPAEPERDLGPFSLPRYIPSFVGRTEIMRQLDKWLTDVDRTDVVVLHGKPGVGKTALAINWAHRQRNRFLDGVQYADLNGYGPGRPTATEAVLATFLTASGMSVKDIPDAGEGLGARTELLRQRLAGRRVLFVLDNAVDSAQVTPLLTATAPNPVLITSRQRMSLVHHGGRGITVPLLEPDEAITFLLRDVRDPHAGQDMESLRDLAALCGGLPIALCVVGEYLATGSDVPLPEITRHLRQRQLLDAGGHGDSGFRSIRAVFDLSVDRFAPDLARFFDLLGVFPSARITTEVATAISGLPAAEVERMFDNLVGVHMVDRLSADSYGLHDLIYQYAEHRALRHVPSAVRDAAIHRMVDWYLYSGRNAIRLMASEDALVPPLTEEPAMAGREFDDADQALRWFLAERSNIIGVSLIAATQNMHEHVWRLVGLFSGELIHHSDPAELVDIHRHALAGARFEGARDGESGILNSLGAIEYRRKKYVVAARYFTTALEIFRDINDEAGEATCLYNLGNTYLERDHFDRAVDYYRLSLAVAARIGATQTEAFVYHRLGDACQRCGQPEQAAPYLRRALRIRTDLDDQRGRAQTLAMLGRVCLDLGNLAAAADHCDEAIAMARRISEQLILTTALRTRAEIDARLTVEI
ncbi:MAG TPA: tetratricopeptide repeat protein [Pseudonocardiaceae bacterium]|nr:tetratricopeptide repeat protein [Pseudonocardiaceae bacterium]